MPKLKYPCTSCKSEPTCGTLCPTFKSWFIAEWYICVDAIRGEKPNRSDAYLKALEDLGLAEVEE